MSNAPLNVRRSFVQGCLLDGSFHKSVPPPPASEPAVVQGESEVRVRPGTAHTHPVLALPGYEVERKSRCKKALRDRMLRKAAADQIGPRVPGTTKTSPTHQEHLSVHSTWARNAWEAIEYAFIRYPERRGLAELLQKAKAPFVSLYEGRSLQGTAIKWLKFHCSYAFAVGVAQTELATFPYEEENREADGCFCTVLQHIMHHAMKRAAGGNWAYRRFLLDILYAKNGMPPAMEGFIKATLADHKAALTRKEPEDWLDNKLLEKPLALVKAEIRKEVTRLFRGVRFTHSDDFPSSGSSTCSPFNKGGAWADLMEDFVVPTRKGGRRVFDENGVVTDDALLVQCFQDYVDDLWTGRLEKKLTVVPVALLEPLKVRVITKGEAAEYYRCIELQKLMHDVLRRHPVFQYVGRPIDDKSFSACFGSQESLLTDEFFVSGDYKAATDNLNPRLSELVWEQICSQVTMTWQGVESLLIDTPYYQLGKKALTGHELRYVCKAWGWNEVLAQTWGQLMGSPMSFPVLCIVNSCATHVALGLDFSRKSKVRINGDDVCFVANPRSYELWKAITAACGLEFSLGKNYCSREFIIMNSECRRAPRDSVGHFYIAGEVEGDPESLEDSYKGDDGLFQSVTWYPGKVWRFEGFFNQSVARNIVRKGQNAGAYKDVHWTDLGPLAKAVLRGIDKNHAKQVLDVFLKTNKAIIAERPVDCNLYLPRCLGGVGIPLPTGVSIEEATTPTSPDTLRRELRRAAYLATHGARRLELPQICLEPSGPLALAVKKARALAPKRVPVPKTDRKHDLGFNATQLLSNVIQFYSVQEVLGENGETDAKGRTYPKCVKMPDQLNFGQHLVSARVHESMRQSLLRKYHSFVDGNYFGLEPMSLRKAFSFEETEMLDSLWPVCGSRSSARTLDNLEGSFDSECGYSSFTWIGDD